MRGVGRSGHSRGPQKFVRQVGRYANPVGALHNILRERATENDTTVGLPCPPSSRGEATAAQKTQLIEPRHPRQHLARRSRVFLRQALSHGCGVDGGAGVEEGGGAMDGLGHVADDLHVFLPDFHFHGGG